MDFLEEAKSLAYTADHTGTSESEAIRFAVCGATNALIAIAQELQKINEREEQRDKTRREIPEGF